MRLKIEIVAFYILFTFFIPTIGIPSQIYPLFEYGNLLFFILFFFLFRVDLKLQWKKIDLKQITTIPIITLVIIGIVVISSNLLPSLDRNVLHIEKARLISLIGAVTINPFVEEIIFRYSFLPLHNNFWSTGILLLISSVLFSLFHGMSFSIFIMGLLLGILYLRKKNLWYPLIVHYINNIIVILLYLSNLR